MFDIENSDDIKLHDNKSGSEEFLRARRVKNIEAVRNETGIKNAAEFPRKWTWFRDNIGVAVIAGVILIVAIGLLKWFFPSIKSYLA